MTRHILIFCLNLIFISTYAAAEGTVESLKKYEYWETGRVKSCTVYDPNGYLKAKAFCNRNGIVEKIEKYDKYGNKIEEAFYDENGKLKANVDGWAAMRWKYDGPSLISQISYGDDSRPIERKQYSEGGRLILRQYIDNGSDSAPYEAATMYMMLGANNLRYESRPGAD